MLRSLCSLAWSVLFLEEEDDDVGLVLLLAALVDDEVTVEAAVRRLDLFDWAELVFVSCLDELCEGGGDDELDDGDELGDRFAFLLLPFSLVLLLLLLLLEEEEERGGGGGVDLADL